MLELLSTGRCAIVKQDFHVGGLGNEIVSPHEGIRPIGAQRVDVCRSREEVAQFFARRRVSGSADDRVVVEHYTPDSRSIYAGFHIGDDDVRMYGHGEMRMTPVINGLITPSAQSSLPPFTAFLANAARMAESVRMMGYRGQLSVDGVLTPDGDMFLTEFNARSGGATHNHCIMQSLVDVDGRADRIMLDRRRCELPPLGSLLATLEDEGIAFDSVKRTGVVITAHDGGAGQGTGDFCVAAEDLNSAELLESAVVTTICKLGGTVASMKVKTGSDA